MKITEGRLTLDFNESFNAIKFDDQEFYRKYFNRLPSAKGVDFLAYNDNEWLFVEVKDCRGTESDNRWRVFPNNCKRETSNTIVDVSNRESLDIEVAQKIAMTIACLGGLKSHCNSERKRCPLTLFAEKFFQMKMQVIRSILILEGDFACHTRTMPMIMSGINSSLTNKLSWLSGKVFVENHETSREKYFKVILS